MGVLKLEQSRPKPGPSVYLTIGVVKEPDHNVNLVRGHVMAKWIIAVFVLSLTACGGGESPQPTAEPVAPVRENNIETMTNHGYGFHYDLITPAGIRVRYSATTNKELFTPEKIDADFKAAATCANYTAVATPMVIFVDEAPGGYGGYTHFATGTILLYRYASIKHEFVHFFMAALAVPNQQNRDHVSPLFGACSL